jgi:hypothetical protein
MANDLHFEDAVNHLVSVLDTLGKLTARGHGLTDWCRPCRRFYRVPMPALIAAPAPLF